MTTQTNRLLSLDVLRGITIAGMILVNNPGSSGYIFKPLRHASWDGLTPTDLIFPFFMFIMGISMFLSLRKFNFELNKQSVLKVLKRTVLIFLVGYALNWFGAACYGNYFDFAHIRLLGVMQRLAIAYGIGSLIGMALKGKHLLSVSGAILIIYALLLKCTGSEVINPTNIVSLVDEAVIGSARMYTSIKVNDVAVPFDPEGLLAALGSIAQVLLGFYCGKLIIESKKDNHKIIERLFIFGTVSLFIGLLFSYGFPINKSLWSSSFVLTTSGFAALFLGLLIWIIDIHQYSKWSKFFEIFGINPLYLYVQAGVLASILGILGTKGFVCENWLLPCFGVYGTPLVWAMLFVIFNWIPGYFLYKNKIYIKL